MKNLLILCCLVVSALGAQMSYAQFIAPTMTGSYLQVYNKDGVGIVQNTTLNWNTVGATAAMVYNVTGGNGATFTNSLQGIVSTANSGLIDTSRILNCGHTTVTQVQAETIDYEVVSVTFNTAVATTVVFNYNFSLASSGFDPINPIYTHGSAVLRNNTDSVDIVNIFTNYSTANTSTYTLAAGKTYTLTNAGAGGRVVPFGSPSAFAVQSNATLSLRVVPVPEPGTMTAIGLGLIAVVRKRRK